MRTITLWIAMVSVGLAYARPARAQSVELDVGEAWNWLVVDFTCHEVLSGSVRDALESGLPARLAVTVELWQDRSSLWDRHVTSVEFSYQILFDVLGETFDVYDGVGEYVASSSELAEIETLVAAERELELAEMDSLDPKREYYVVVDARLSPLSIREIRDLEGWLRGNISKEKGSRFSGISDHLIGILKNQVGMGEQKTTGRSPRFKPPELRTRDIEEDS